jgi:NodT family efflux transporter outer membrane factor (OMF) lipoprotein
MARIRKKPTSPCLGAVIGSLLLSGCTTVGPDFKQPEVPWLEGWQGGSLQEVVSSSPSAGATDEWWLLFDDPILDQIVADALRLNPGVRTAGARILESRAQLGVAGSGRYPQLQQLSGSLLEVGEHTSGEPNTQYTAGSAAFDIAWELDFWGRYRRAIEAADAAYFASIAQYDDVQVLVASQAASLYATIRTLELRLRITHQNAEIQQRSLEITERLFKSGNESELDVQQARSLYLSTIATIPELEGALRQAQNALSVLLARPPGELPEMASGAEQIPEASLETIVDIPADLLRRRPDVRTAELQLAAQSALIGVSQSALYPSITLLGSVGLSDTSLASSSSTVDWAVGPAFVWNIFDWGRLKNDVLIQDARFQQLYEIYQDAVLRAAREVDDAAVLFAKNRVQVDILDQAVQAARRSLDIATIQYREGMVDFERVLDSQRSLFSQEERLVTVRGSVAQSLIALYKAIGGGWQAGRGRPAVDAATQDMMERRSKWKDMTGDPLPPASK